MKRREIADALAEIAEQGNGRLTPDQVVEAAKNRKHILHGYFDWDNKVAGAAWRRHQARNLINSVRIQYKVNRSSVSTVAYARDPSAAGDEQGYVSLRKVKTEEENAREVIVDYFTRASRAITMAKEVAAVLEIDEEVDDLLSRVDHLSRRVAGEGLRE